jgi:phosphate uptake regulator
MSRHGPASTSDSSSMGADPTLFPDLAELPSFHNLGNGRIESRKPDHRVEKVLRIEASGAPENLLGRLLVGSYITGHDRVVICSHRRLTKVQRREIHRMVDRILGMSVVGDRPKVIEVQSFLDPGRYELPKLLHRVVQMLRSELQACRSALLEPGPSSLGAIEILEEEIDQLYLLMVRQLLLSSDSPRIARHIDVESRHFQIGDRVVAKTLEFLGDLVVGIATELRGNLPDLQRLPAPSLRSLAGEIRRIDQLLAATMTAFSRLSAVDANATLNRIGVTFRKESRLAPELVARAPTPRIAAACLQISFYLEMITEMLICINEITINRSVEPETMLQLGPPPGGPARRVGRTQLLTYAPIQLNGGPLGAPAGPSSAHRGRAGPTKSPA